MKTPFLLFVFLIVLAVTSCKIPTSEDVDQQRIFTTYELFYDKNENRTYAKALFNLDNSIGTPLLLREPSQVSFNGEVLSYNKITGRYEKFFTGFLRSGTFVYTNNQGVSYTNVTPAMDTIEFMDPTQTLLLQKGIDFILTWLGNPLDIAKEETISVFIDNKAFVQLNNNTTSVILGGSILNELNPGPYIASMERAARRAQLVEAPRANGILLLRYKTLNRSVQLSQ